MTPPQTHLSAICPRFKALIARTGPCTMEIDPTRSLYLRLLRAIAHQQLNGRAAETIFARFLALFPEHEIPPPEHILHHSDQALRATGFSFAKIAAIRDIAAKAIDGTIPTPTDAQTIPDEDLITRLVTIRGVGRWTVEMLLMGMGRPDILPIDDFGVREGYKRLHNLETQPKPRELATLGLPWAPFRSTAAWYLWRVADEAKLRTKV